MTSSILTKKLTERDVKFIQRHNFDIKEKAANGLAAAGNLEWAKVPEFIKQTTYTATIGETEAKVDTDIALFAEYRQRSIDAYHDSTSPEKREKEVDRILAIRIDTEFDLACEDVRRQYPDE